MKVIRNETRIVSEGDTTTRTTRVTRSSYRFYEIIWFVASVVEAVIFIRVLLKFFAANPNSGFTQLIYKLSAPLVVPFTGIFPTLSTGVGVSIVEWSSIVAIIVYALLAYGIVQLIRISTPKVSDQVDETKIVE